jgi:hypothetical protein
MGSLSCKGIMHNAGPITGLRIAVMGKEPMPRPGMSEPRETASHRITI